MSQTKRERECVCAFMAEFRVTEKEREREGEKIGIIHFSHSFKTFGGPS